MNKLMARIVAVVMAIAMLGTVSFAAGSANYAEGDISDVNAGNAAGQDIVTILAYATDSYTDEEFTAGSDVIIALQQVDEIATINVDPERVGNKPFITIAFGGSEGKTDYAHIDVRGTVGLTTIIADREVTLVDEKTGEAVTYTNVAYAVFEVPTNGAITEYGIKFNSYASEGATEPKDAEQEIKVSKTLAEPTTISGNVTFAAVVLGVPYADFAEGTVIKATSYVVYAQ